MTLSATHFLVQQSRLSPVQGCGAAVLEDRKRPKLTSPLCESAKRDFEMRNSVRVAGKVPVKVTRNIPAFEITHGDYLERVRDAMRNEAGDRPGAAKYIAAKVECSPKTAQSWLDGETAPSGLLCSRAMNRIPAYAALKLEIAAMEIDLDPRIQAKYQELHALMLAIAGGPRGGGQP